MTGAPKPRSHLPLLGQGSEETPGAFSGRHQGPCRWYGLVFGMFSELGSAGKQQKVWMKIEKSLRCLFAAYPRDSPPPSGVQAVDASLSTGSCKEPGSAWVESGGYHGWRWS